MDAGSSLIKFYEGKSHEPRGGEMFRVYNRIEHVGNWWGRSKDELRIYLIGKSIRFTRIDSFL